MEQRLMRNSESYNIVVDCDEVLTDISPIWVKKIYENREKFEKYFDLRDDVDASSIDPFSESWREYVLGRDKFYINDWLRKKDLVLSEEEEKHLFKMFYDLYDNDAFYSECLPTKFCEGIYKLSLQSYVKKIYVVTRTSENTYTGKERFIKSFLPTDKLEIVFVKMGENKSGYINKIDNVSMIADDEVKNIEDIIDNCSDKHRKVDFYVPHTGYNNPTAELFEKADKSEYKLKYFPILKSSENIAI